MPKSNNQLLQDQWTSKWAFILAATGAAVGLGNVWRFPYMAGTNGGSAFVVMYLVFVVLIGLPIMIAEILIGRRARQNPVDALKTLAKESGHTQQWGWLGWWGALALLLVLSFYSVVSGWSIAYFVRCMDGSFTGLSPPSNQPNLATFSRQPLATHWLAYTIYMSHSRRHYARCAARLGTKHKIYDARPVYHPIGTRYLCRHHQRF